jgi:hypothetical protein
MIASRLFPKDDKPAVLKSCGCRKILCCKEFQPVFVETQLSPVRRRMVADREFRFHDASAWSGLWPSTVGWVISNVNGWLDKLPNLQAITDLAQRSVKKACKQFDLYLSEVMHICRRVKKLSADARDWYDRMSSWKRNALEEAMQGIHAGIRDACEVMDDRREMFGSARFSQREFSSTGRLKSYYRQTYEILTSSILVRTVCRAVFGSNVDVFVDDCGATMRSRSAMRGKVVDAYRENQAAEEYRLMDLAQDPDYDLALYRPIAIPSQPRPKPQGKFYSPVPLIKMPVAMMERLLSGFPLPAGTHQDKNREWSAGCCGLPC